MIHSQNPRTLTRGGTFGLSRALGFVRMLQLGPDDLTTLPEPGYDLLPKPYKDDMPSRGFPASSLHHTCICAQMTVGGNRMALQAGLHCR